MKISKFVSPSQRQQERSLGSASDCLESRSFPPCLQGREIDVGCQVLFTGCSVEILGHAMVSVSEEGAPHVVLVKEFGRTMTVINGKHIASIEPPADFTDPVASFEPGFGVLSLLQSDALCCEILGDRASRKRCCNIYKVSIVEADEYFSQPAVLHHDSVHRQRINQFIGKEAALRNMRRNFDGSREMASVGVSFQSRCRLLAPRGGAFHSDITQRIVKSGEFRSAEIQNV